MREAHIREHTEKLKFMIGELVSILEFGNLKSLARANYEAFLEAKRKKLRMSMWKAFKELRNPEVKLTIGFLLLLMKKVGKVIEGEEDIR
ncbi:MAG TPA: DUF1641 domain-containing protein [Aquifex aeolicus]|nr:DUF1641 domain-containing protein [Aquifex aeolicus]